MTPLCPIRYFVPNSICGGLFKRRLFKFPSFVTSHLQTYSRREFTVQKNSIVSMTEEKDELIREARLITLSFWRICIRCIRLLREVDCDKPSSSLPFFNMMQDDEVLQKKWRSDYYLDWASESIFQESDCLNGEWSQENVDRYLFFIRQGEEKRQWLLKEFKIAKDPYTFPHDRLLAFETRAYRLLGGKNVTNNVESSFPSEDPEDDEDWEDEKDW
jgi:hypothetical protein